MKLNDNLVEFENEGTIESSGVARIAEEDIAMAFSIVSEGFYSDIYGSIVREVTSNCVDSHIEAGKEDVAVEIKFTEDEGTDFISFIDKGVGMSQEFFENVFMSYFKSTKRESNAYYGAFGIGSKSPLGYQDSYEVITTKDGITSHYVIGRSVSGPPEFTLLNQRETPLKDNGTEVKVVIEPGDKQKFIKAIRQQLQYFDNVIVTGIPFNNNYYILEGETFKYRTDSYGAGEGLDKLHIAIGRVTYPIDFKRLGLTDINCSIGVKFNIGELIVTKNRENLRYDSDECNSLIKERIEGALAELGKLYNKQNTEGLTLEEYIKKQTTYNKYVLLGTVGSYDARVELPLPYRYVTGPRGGEKKEYLVKGLTDAVYLPLKGLNLTLPKNPFFMFEVKKWFDLSNKRNFGIVDDDIWKLLTVKDVRLIRFSKKDVEVGKKNKYIFWSKTKDGTYLKAIGLITPKSSTGKEARRRKWALYNENLGLNIEEELNDNNRFQTNYNRIFRRNYTDSIPNISDGLNKTKRIIAFKKAMIKEIVSRTEAYRDFRVTSEFEEFMKSQIERVRLPSNVFKVTTLRNSASFKFTSEDVLKSRQLVVYGFNGETKKLRAIEHLLALSRIGQRYTNLDTYDMHIIPKKALPYYEANKHYYSMEEFLTNGNKVFRRALTTFVIKRDIEKLRKFSYLKMLLPTLSTKINDIFNKLDYSLSWQERNMLTRLESEEMKDFMDDCIAIMEQNNWWDLDRLEEFKTLTDWFEGLDLLKYVDITAKVDNIATKELIEYLKFKKKKLDAVHYFKVNETEDAIIKFFLNKIKDLERVNEDKKVRNFNGKLVKIPYLNVYNHGS